MNKLNAYASDGSGHVDEECMTTYWPVALGMRIHIQRRPPDSERVLGQLCSLHNFRSMSLVRTPTGALPMNGNVIDR